MQTRKVSQRGGEKSRPQPEREGLEEGPRQGQPGGVLLGRAESSALYSGVPNLELLPPVGQRAGMTPPPHTHPTAPAPHPHTHCAACRAPEAHWAGSVSITGGHTELFIPQALLSAPFIITVRVHLNSARPVPTKTKKMIS